MDKKQDEKKKKNKKIKKIAAGIGIGAAAVGGAYAYKNRDKIKKFIDNIKDEEKKDDDDIKIKKIVNRITDKIKNKQSETKSSEPLFDDFCFESFNNYNMIADELQYRIDVSDLTFEEAELINDIAYERYVIEAPDQSIQLLKAGVPIDSLITSKYLATRDDKSEFEDRDISSLPNKKALKKPERMRRDILSAQALQDRNNRRDVVTQTDRHKRGETQYMYDTYGYPDSPLAEVTPSMRKAERLLGRYGSTSREEITADSTRKKNIAAGVLTRKIGGFDKDATYWMHTPLFGSSKLIKRNSPPGFEPGSVKTEEELKKEGEKGRFTLPKGYVLVHKRSEDGLKEIKPGNVSSTYATNASGGPGQIHGRGRIYCTIQKENDIKANGWGEGGHGYVINSPVRKLHFDPEDSKAPRSKVNIKNPEKLIGISVYIETNKPLKCRQIY